MRFLYRALHDLFDAQRNFEQLEQHGIFDDTQLGGILAGTLPKPSAPTLSWTAPTLINSWVNVGGAGVATAGYLKDGWGFVHLKGRVKTGTFGTNAFVLPAGFRPGATDYYPMIQAGVVLAAAVIDASGNVGVFNASGGAATDVSFGGITFLAEN